MYYVYVYAHVCIPRGYVLVQWGQRLSLAHWKEQVSDVRALKPDNRQVFCAALQTSTSTSCAQWSLSNKNLNKHLSNEDTSNYA